MKKRVKKLVLAKETVRTLEVRKVRGGDEFSASPSDCLSACCPFTGGCPPSRAWNCFAPASYGCPG
jgi:hypothetical protein